MTLYHCSVLYRVSALIPVCLGQPVVLRWCCWTSEGKDLSSEDFAAPVGGMRRAGAHVHKGLTIRASNAFSTEDVSSEDFAALVEACAEQVRMYIRD